MFALPVVHPSSVTPFGERVAWWWNADDLYPWLDIKEARLTSGRSTGTMTVALAGLLGVETAYLIGHDLAFNAGKSHGAGTSATALEAHARIEKELSRTSGNYYRRIFDTAQNGGGIIETMGVWDIFRSDVEGIIFSNKAVTKFINVNVLAKVGAVIEGAHEGVLPQESGVTLDKSHPERASTEEEWIKYRDRCRKLLDDFNEVKKRFIDVAKELETWKPLSHDRKAVEKMGVRVDLTEIVSKENRAWFAYVFRAVLRNLMVRLHHNTYVGTMAERNWNQVQVIRLYTQSIPQLINRLQPELEAALEKFK
jgi:hypothetical protein